MKYEIVQDEFASNPRKEFDHLGTMLYTSTRYLLGDEQVDSDRIKEVTLDPSVIVIPVYAYIHSGVVLNTKGFSCPWDSGQCGVIYVSSEKVLKEWKRKKMSNKLILQVLKTLEAEVEEFSNYLAGEVYGYRILDDEGEEVDSCYGFYGRDYCEEEAKQALENLKPKAA